MILIVGLGNYGIEYAGTNHNAGFMVLDRLCDETGIEITKRGFKSLYYKGNLFGESVVIAKPQTYMNLSGEAVVELKNFFKPDKILIVFDDYDLPYGTVRYRKNGSAGTHNGMRNIVSLTGTQDISRIKIGIKPQETVYNLIDFVTSKVPKSYKEIFDASLDEAVQKIKLFVENKGEIKWTLCQL